ncbi:MULTISPECIES: hypothetical protein [Actinotignum]|uniref:hypothetical protein n=1 Tax=Actinotignum TaxID=1653174 RepID=UPI0025512F0C|nr:MULTISPECIES: hypothetical protein [Actinotignum]MDE1537129.1 hypothetical protein [Actinotignum schaalii]MDY5144597.1 hypothetical protein [Actinotignum timonense]
MGEAQTKFLDAYVSSGKEPVEVIRRLATISQRVLLYLITQAKLEESLRIELVDVVIANIETSTALVDHNVIEYLRNHCADLPMLTDYGTPEQAERVAKLFTGENILLPSLKPLSLNVRPAFISRDLYEITHENLSIAINNDETVGLDTIRDADKNVYGYVLNNLRVYLDAVADSSATIDDCEQFGTVLEDLSEQELSLLDTVIKRASSSCQITELGSVPERVWPVLAQDQRFSATFSNVNRYLDSQGIDESLSSLLARAGEISKVESIDEEEKVTVATKILAAREKLPDAKLRVDLVMSLRLNAYLNIGEIAAEEGNLFALLLRNKLIKDTAAVYRHLKAMSWPTRREVLCESSNFRRYMTPELLKADVASILTDDRINWSIKLAIAQKIAEYAEVTDQRGQIELARCALRKKQRVPVRVVEKMAMNGVPPEFVVALLEPHLRGLERTELFRILKLMGGDYGQLTTTGSTRVRIPDTPADRALLERLKEEGIVIYYRSVDSTLSVKRQRFSFSFDNMP